MNNADFQLRGGADPRLAVHAASPLPAWLWSTDGMRILWANPVGARVFGAADAAVLAQLMCELGYETTTAEMSLRLKSILSDPRYSTIVAEIDNKLCGMIGTLTHVSHEHNDRSGKRTASPAQFVRRETCLYRQ